MAKPKKDDDQYSEKEAKRRFEQALRGSRFAKTEKPKKKPAKKTG